MYFGPAGTVSTLMHRNGSSSSNRRAIVATGSPGPPHSRSWIIRTSIGASHTARNQATVAASSRSSATGAWTSTPAAPCVAANSARARTLATSSALAPTNTGTRPAACSRTARVSVRRSGSVSRETSLATTG